MSTVAESSTAPIGQSWSVWHIDPRHSLAEFSVRHMMLSKVRGRFTGVSGTIVDAAEDPKHSSVKAEVDVTTPITGDPQRASTCGRRWVTMAQGGSSAGGPVLEVEVEVLRDVPTAVAGWLQRQDPLAGQAIGACDADWLRVRSDTVQLHCREANVEILMSGPTVDADNAALAALLRRIKPAPGA